MKKFIYTLLLSMCLPTVMMGAIEVGKTYVIASNSNNAKVLSVSNSSLASGADIVVWTDTDVPSQQWTVVSTSNGTYALQNVYSGMFLSRGSLFREGLACKTINGSTTSRATFDITAVNASANVYTISQTSGDATNYIAASSAIDGSTVEQSGTAYQWKFIEVAPQTTFTRQQQAGMMESWLNQFLVNRTATGSTFGEGGGWGDAEMLETMLDAYETTGDKSYIDVFTKVYNYFRSNVGTSWTKLVYTDSYKWYGHEYNDDVMWMILASVRAYLLTGTSRYLTYGKSNFDAVYSRAFNQWGMMRWKEGSDSQNGSNSCINCPTIVAACYIAIATGDDSYYEKARNLYDNQRKNLFNASTGEVYDSGSFNASTGAFSVGNKWVSTYNQGTMLGAAVMLYNRYGTATYLNDAQKIMSCAEKNLSDANGIIKVCQEVSGDRCGFKGILVRYARRYATDLAQPAQREWLMKNAFHAYNNANSSGYAHSAWLTKSAEDGTFNNNERYDNQAFGCSTAVSAAFNTPMHDIIRDAFNTIKAEDFDYQYNLDVKKVGGSDENAILTNLTNDQYAAYYNLDFGTEGATELTLNLTQTGSGNASTIEVRLDKVDGELIGTVNVPANNIPAVLTATIAKTTGQHHVFLKFVATSTAVLPYSLDSFAFKTGNETAINEVSTTADAAPHASFVGNQLVVKTSEAAYVSVFNLQGQQLAAFNSQAGTTTKAANWPRGTYIVSVATASKTTRLKIKK